ncbi:hypothetical protein TGAMA5MH_09225 [Trichoderma gamsii]|nr:hypothetical protein TGAMA5MH_09225 [Trichoderma gamsii]
MSRHSFLITGASSGLGLEIALEALKQGHVVAAGARNPSEAAKQHPEVQQLGGKWVELDVTRADTKESVARIVKDAGVDVLINCAGYGILGSLENTDEDEFIAQVNTNTFGTMRTIKGALPHFRSLAESGGATIVNIGSLVTFGHFPACSAYGASKGAVEGLSETLALEVGPAKVRVVLIDLGIFRTRFLHAAVKPKSGLHEAYVGGSVDNTVSFLDGVAGKQPGDPALAGKRIVEIVDGTGLAKDLATQGYGKLLRVPLGSDAFEALKGKEASLAELHALETLARSTDFAN